MGGSDLLPRTTRTSYSRGAVPSASNQSAALQPAFLRGYRPGVPFQAKSSPHPHRATQDLNQQELPSPQNAQRVWQNSYV
ncbi:hypothetical protein QC763_0010630 [Podospora pseudopauciseta]|uniref:Uncharacterized protein n=1 Tax=Podospora pseudopauciseta TaxID=2093780 RepID=A0ABR0HZE5_9PEZI|nr:hypothetical protein QC763_0010630 [Podospora pseudopauciseta]